MTSSLATNEPGHFFLRTYQRDRVLCCTRCGCRKRIADRAGAQTEAEDAHECSLPCGCWSPGEHNATCDERPGD